MSRRDLLIAVAAAAIGIRTSAKAQDLDVHDNPMRAAEEISKLEVIEHIPALYTFYDLMHPDAKEIVPRHVVIRYFREVFQTRKPQPAVATGVTYRDWTWGVNGVTYPNTAEVSFRQVFANETIEDVVRLVKDHDTWKWFFGRDRAWVAEQIQRFSQTKHVPEEGTVPYGLKNATISTTMLERLPETMRHNGTNSRLETVDDREMPLPGWASNVTSLRYVLKDELYPGGFAQILAIHDGLTVAAAIRQQVKELQTKPPFTLHGWNLEATTQIPFACVEVFESDAVGNAQATYWGAADGRLVAMISHIDESALREMAASLIR